MKPFKNLLLIAAVLCGANSAFAQTWTQTSAPSNQWLSVASSADGAKLAAVASGPFTPPYTSADSGFTWTPTATPSPGNSPPTYFLGTGIASSADGSKLLLAATADGVSGIYLSTNSGATWISANLPVTNWFAVASSADGSKLAAAAGSSDFSIGEYFGPIYTSTNAGTTWTPTAAPAEVWSSIASSADGTRLIAAAEFNGSSFIGPIYISTNSGTSWLLTTAPSNYWLSVASSADGSKLLAAAGWTPYGPMICTSTNSGATWTSNNLPQASWQAVASSADGNKWAALSQDGQSYVSTDWGTTWVSNSIPAQPCSALASSADGNKLVASVLYFSFGGTSGGIWTSQTTPAPSLNIAPTNGEIELSWVVPSTNFVLQQNFDLATTNWADVTNQPVLNLTNLQDEVILPPPGSNVFYRLKTP